MSSYGFTRSIGLRVAKPDFGPAEPGAKYFGLHTHQAVRGTSPRSLWRERLPRLGCCSDAAMLIDSSCRAPNALLMLAQVSMEWPRDGAYVGRGDSMVAPDAEVLLHDYSSIVLLSLRCEGLRKGRNTLAVVYSKLGTDDLWTEYGSTEICGQETCWPVWEKMFELQFRIEHVRLIRVEIYIIRNQNMQEDLMEQKFVGSAEFNLAEAVYARSNPKNHGWLKKKLENVRRKPRDPPLGKLLVYAEESINAKVELSFQLSAHDLKSTDFWKRKCDPYFVMNRIEGVYDTGELFLAPVYRSEVARKTSEASYEESSYTVAQTSSCDIYQDVIITVHDWFRLGQDRYIGECITTFEELQKIVGRGNPHTFPLYKREGPRISGLTRVKTTAAMLRSATKSSRSGSGSRSGSNSRAQSTLSVERADSKRKSTNASGEKRTTSRLTARPQVSDQKSTYVVASNLPALAESNGDDNVIPVMLPVVVMVILMLAAVEFLSPAFITPKDSITDIRTSSQISGHSRMSHSSGGSKTVSMTSSEVRNQGGKGNFGPLVGSVTLDGHRFKRHYTFLDYLRGGLELQLMVAVDFTRSNLGQTNPKSMHSVVNMDEETAYSTAIRALGEVMSVYDNDKCYPIYGFGAKIPPSHSVVSNCFALTGDFFQPEVEGVEGMLKAYHRALRVCHFHGPSYLSEVIKLAANMARPYVQPKFLKITEAPPDMRSVEEDKVLRFLHDNSSVVRRLEFKRYFVLLVLTDGDIEEATDRTSPRPACLTRLSHGLFPFLKLRHATEEPFWRRCCESQRTPRPSETFLAGLGFWLLAVAVVCYLLLTISSTTFLMKEVPDSKPKKYEAISKFPGSGRHIYYFLLVKRLVEVTVLNHLCGNLMEPLPAMYQKRFEDLEHMRPHGVVRGLQRLITSLFRRQHREKWLTSFVPDYILLLVVGSMGIVYVVVLCSRKLDVHVYQETEHFIIARNDPGSAALLIVDSVVYAYTMVLVTGFLLCTLEQNVVAKPDRQREFFSALALFIMLWGTNFFTTLYDRQIYTSAWGLPAPATIRILASAAQVFVTHSMVMMGAVLFGHSAHLRRTPDLTWKDFLLKLLPSVLLLAVAGVWVGLQRQFHEHSECFPEGYRLFAQTWPYFTTLVASLGGLALLLLTFCARARDAEESDFTSLLDYDSLLIMLTVSLAVIGNINTIFAMEASRAIGSFCGALARLLGPIGISTFAFAAWKDPPRREEPRLAGVMFIEFQNLEDCEIASDMPGCCTYPGLPGYNTHEHRNLKCSKDLRCMVTQFDTPCDLGDAEDLESLNITQLKQEFSPDMCDDLADRWYNYTLQDDTGYSYAMQDAEEEEDEESTAYKLFKTIGQAASVEMYFTIFGVLLKVIFLTQHPNSAPLSKSFFSMFIIIRPKMGPKMDCPLDQEEVVRQIRECIGIPLSVIFVGIGVSQDFKFLRELAKDIGQILKLDGDEGSSLADWISQPSSASSGMDPGQLETASLRYISLLPHCVHSLLLWFLPDDTLCRVCSACRFCCEAANQHPSWQRRLLQKFGGEFLDLTYQLPKQWKGLFLRLTRASDRLNQLGGGGSAAGTCAPRQWQCRFPLCPLRQDMELQWSLVVPSESLDALAVLCYDGVSCALHDVTNEKVMVLWRNRSDGVEPLRAVVGQSCIFLLASASKIDVYSFAGVHIGELPLAQEQEIDLLHCATDLFLAERRLVIETSTMLLVWDVAGGSQICRVPPDHHPDKDGEGLQGRPCGRGVVATWFEEGGRDVEFWDVQAAPRLLTCWVPGIQDSECVLVTFATSPLERLLVAIDSANVLHVALMVEDSEETKPIDLYSCQLFPAHGSRVLSCSIAVRCGMLAFVEAADLEAKERELHVWQLAHHGELLSTPIRLTCPFCTRGLATVSVPKPMLGRFVLLKGCSAMEESPPFVSAHLFSLDCGRLHKVYTHGEIACDSTLFRRGHPLSDLCLGFWNLEEGCKSLSLVDLATGHRRPRGLQRFEDKDGNPLPKYIPKEPINSQAVPVKAMRIPTGSASGSRDTSKVGSSRTGTNLPSGSKTPESLGRSPAESRVNSKAASLRLENADEDEEPWPEEEDSDEDKTKNEKQDEHKLPIYLEEERLRLINNGVGLGYEKFRIVRAIRDGLPSSDLDVLVDNMLHGGYGHSPTYKDAAASALSDVEFYSLPGMAQPGSPKDQPGAALAQSRKRIRIGSDEDDEDVDYGERLRELAQPPKSLDRRMQGRLGLLPRDRVQIKVVKELGPPAPLDPWETVRVEDGSAARTLLELSASRNESKDVADRGYPSVARGATKTLEEAAGMLSNLQNAPPDLSLGQAVSSADDSPTLRAAGDVGSEASEPDMVAVVSDGLLSQGRASSDF
ncbi:Cpne9 [Symbiodinium sp. KB8]|nr:Cpne9 [Symbiodinium sp. KB8]